jgi:hypothetical protein
LLLLLLSLLSLRRLPPYTLAACSC